MEKSKSYFDPGSRQSRFGGFSGDPRRVIGGPSRIVVGSVVSVVVDSARSARMRATSGKSLFTETLYVAQIIDHGSSIIDH